MSKALDDALSRYDKPKPGNQRELRRALHRAARRGVALYRELRDVHHFNRAYSEDERTTAVADLADYQRALQEADRLPPLADDTKGWVERFAGSRGLGAVERACSEREAAESALQVTIKGIEGMGRTPRRFPDNAAAGTAAFLAEEWVRQTGRGAQYKKRNTAEGERERYSTFGLWASAVLRVASGKPDSQWWDATDAGAGSLSQPMTGRWKGIEKIMALDPATSDKPEKS